MTENQKPVKVTVSDPETGAVIEEKLIADDYCLVTAGSRYLKSIQVMGNSHMLAIAVRKSGEGSS